MTSDQIKQGGTYVGRNGVLRKVLIIARLETWQRATVTILKRLACTYETGGTERTVQLQAFAKWAIMEVTR